jgi:hypothetical protein
MLLFEDIGGGTTGFFFSAAAATSKKFRISDNSDGGWSGGG